METCRNGYGIIGSNPLAGADFMSLREAGGCPGSIIRSKICSDLIRKNGYRGGLDPDPDLDFTDSADPDINLNNEILGPDIWIRTYYLFKIFNIQLYLYMYAIYNFYIK